MHLHPGSDTDPAGFKAGTLFVERPLAVMQFLVAITVTSLLDNYFLSRLPSLLEEHYH